MATTSIPLYFEASWSILSTIGIVNTLLGLLVIGITGFSPIALVPITCSIATAIANGLCYYALYENHSKNATLIGGIFADVFWLIQEAGLSFYSYLILLRVLRSRARLTFLTLFWLCITLITSLRIAILTCRALDTLSGTITLQALIARLHIGYFVFIAVIEIISAFFLIRIFARAKEDSAVIERRGGLFRYLTQSTELRLAMLAVIGVTRAVTYSFQKTTKASDGTGQLDRFVFTLECMFPVVMYVDILASRIATAAHAYATSSNGQPGSRSLFPRSRAERDIQMYSTAHHKSRTGGAGETSSSQERIVGATGEEEMGVKSMVETVIDYDGERKHAEDKNGTISKTVEFQFHESSA